MKRVFVALVCSVCSLFISAQPRSTAIHPQEVAISDSLTTTLIFPYNIIKVSWCSPYFAVQQTREVGNALEIKATARDFSPSNLSVVTRDGQFYSFLLHYEKYAYPFTWRFAKDSSLYTPVTLNECPANEKVLEDNAWRVKEAKGFMRRQKANAGLRTDLRGIFLSHDIHWLSLHLKNKSSVPIHIARATVSVRYKQLRNNIAQTNPQEIIYQTLPQIIDGNQINKVVLAVPRLSIRKQQVFIIELFDAARLPVITQAIPARLLRKSKILPHE